MPSGIPSTDSRRSLLFLPPGCSLTHLTHPPHPPDPEGRIFYLLLLSSAPSSPSFSPDQAALSWRWGLLHLPLITPPPALFIYAFRQGRTGALRKWEPSCYFSFLISANISLGGSPLFQPPRGEVVFTRPLSSFSPPWASQQPPNSSPDQVV